MHIKYFTIALLGVASGKMFSIPNRAHVAGFKGIPPPGNIPGNLIFMNIWRYSLRNFVLLSIISMVSFTPAHAQLMKLDFKGSITSISTYYAPPGINLGDDVSGELFFDSAASDGQPLAWMGYFEDAIIDCKLTIGEKTFSMPESLNTSEIDIINDELIWGKYYDYILFRVAVIDQSIDVERFFQLTFTQSDVIPPTVLTGDALTMSFDINTFETKTGFLTYFPPDASEGNNITLTSVLLYPADKNPGSNITPWLILLLE